MADVVTFEVIPEGVSVIKVYSNGVALCKCEHAHTIGIYTGIMCTVCKQTGSFLARDWLPVKFLAEIPDAAKAPQTALF